MHTSGSLKSIGKMGLLYVAANEPQASPMQTRSMAFFILPLYHAAIRAAIPHSGHRAHPTGVDSILIEIDAKAFAVDCPVGRDDKSRWRHKGWLDERLGDFG